MRRVGSYIVYVICGMALLGTGLMSQGQRSTPIAPAPIPAPIVAAKSLFVANGGAEDFPQDANTFSGGPDRAYNQFYAEMKKLGRFRLVTNPSDADIVIEIRVTSSSVPAGNSSRMDSQLHAVVIEPKTHVTMWVVATRIVPAIRQSARDQNFDQAMEYIFKQIKGLTGTP